MVKEFKVGWGFFRINHPHCPSSLPIHNLLIFQIQRLRFGDLFILCILFLLTEIVSYQIKKKMDRLNWDGQDSFSFAIWRPWFRLL